ncbi:MAG: MXAN_5187 C-terminal domain-containing protein, partial [Myxococcaceae bacterium]
APVESSSQAPAAPIHIAGTPPPEPLSENRLRSVYRAYVEAKRRCNEDTTRLSFDAVAASLKRQVPELLERHNARDVEYRVFVKDGKAILRAVPKL